MKNKKEEISDIISPAAYDDPDFKKGIVLKFEKATIKITKVDRKNKRAWGEHITLVSGNVAGTHEMHNVTAGGPGDLPYCEDCKVNINVPATEDGEFNAKDHQDDDVRKILSA